MIERIFLISEQMVLSGKMVPPEENLYYSIRVDPGVKDSLEAAYTLVEQATDIPMALTLDIREDLTAESIRSVTSFLFIPSYLTLESRPVIILKSDLVELLNKATDSLSAYFSLQGIAEPVIHKIFPGNPDMKESVTALTTDYKQLLQNPASGCREIFFYTTSGDALQAALSSLKEVETDFEKQFPQLWSLLQTNKRLEKELQSLRRKYSSTETELNHQKQYIDILHSDHAAKELQDYYTREYEILPLWYKRLGHILKVLTGKRTFKSLFRDGVKKYKD